MGKTRLMLQRLDDCPRVLYIDPKGGEYPYGDPVHTAAEIVAATKGKPEFCVRCVKPSWQATTWICQHAMQLSAEGPLIVAVDELALFGDHDTYLEGFQLIQIEGGMRGVSFIGTVHRPEEVHNRLRSQADRIISFQMKHRGDIAALKRNIDVDIPEDEFRALAQDHYLIWEGEDYRIQKIKP